MYKKSLFFLCIFSISVFGQKQFNYNDVDSLTYQSYINGNWKELIETAKKANSVGIDFKYLQQRVGYAYYAMGNYYKSIEHYKNALKFDKKDSLTHTFLYYCGLNLPDEQMAAYHLSKLSKYTGKSFGVSAFKLIDMIDFESNFKFNDSYQYPVDYTRSNPYYNRLGIITKLSHRLNLYQSLSVFNQTYSQSTAVNQIDYFGSLSYVMFSRTALNLGLHSYSTKIVNSSAEQLINKSLLTANIDQGIGALNFALKTSVITGDTAQLQTSFSFGFHLPGKIKPFVNSVIYNINYNNTSRWLYEQKIGILPFRNLWLEANVLFGDQYNFVDNNGLYVFNSYDHTTFKTGFTGYLYLSRKLTLFANYNYEIKQIPDNTVNYSYNQHSVSGGLIIKL